VSECYQQIVNEGEVIYYPTSYWHQTLNLQTPTISLTSSLVNSYNFQDLINDFEKECLKDMNVVFSAKHHPVLCSNLLFHCPKIWKQLWEKDD